MAREQWRPVEGFPGYDVSDEGRVRSWRPVNQFSPPPAEPRMLLLGVDGSGYFKVDLRRHGKKSTHSVHVLVAATFNGPRPTGLDVAHDDGDHSNNRASNLVYKTRAENEADKKRHGRDQSGSRHWTKREAA